MWVTDAVWDSEYTTYTSTDAVNPSGNYKPTSGGPLSEITLSSSAGIQPRGAPSTAAFPCPLYDEQQYIDSNGDLYDIQCSTNYPGNNITIIPGITNEQCILACDNHSGSPACVAVSWMISTGNCELKSNISQILYDQLGYDSAKTHTYSRAASSTPAPTPPTITSNPVCPDNNNTRYTDVFGFTHHIRCGLGIVGDASYAAHADSFSNCLNYCDLLGGCAGVTYTDGAASNASNCKPYTSFEGYSPSTSIGSYSGVPINGATNTEGQLNVCGIGYNQTSYMDTFGKSYFIGCNQKMGSSRALYSMVTDTLEGCLTYCSLYSGCVGVGFTGYPVRTDTPNCFPMAATGSVTYYGMDSYAMRNDLK